MLNFSGASLKGSKGGDKRFAVMVEWFDEMVELEADRNN